MGKVVMRSTHDCLTPGPKSLKFSLCYGVCRTLSGIWHAHVFCLPSFLRSSLPPFLQPPPFPLLSLCLQVAGDSAAGAWQDVLRGHRKRRQVFHSTRALDVLHGTTTNCMCLSLCLCLCLCCRRGPSAPSCFLSVFYLPRCRERFGRVFFFNKLKLFLPCPRFALFVFLSESQLLTTACAVRRRGVVQ